ncbi:hypothetical protein [Comamonas sp.]|jgi:hypothetical protein|nr:hypothetical protein [Comamonas sp.]
MSALPIHSTESQSVLFCPVAGKMGMESESNESLKEAAAIGGQ